MFHPKHIDLGHQPLVSLQRTLPSQDDTRAGLQLLQTSLIQQKLE
jgi:hypothetical protein